MIYWESESEPNRLEVIDEPNRLGIVYQSGNDLTDLINEGYALGVADILWTVDQSQVRYS
jgi:hypothetical protein